MIGPLLNKNILLLQGPMGPFFRKLDKALRVQGARVYRICLNGGDFLFANKDNSHQFTGTPERWRFYINRFLKQHRIHKIFLYGDCRFYHRQAKIVASRLAIETYVFEEGYVRPHFITLEKGGVNAHSAMPDQADEYRNLPSMARGFDKHTTVRHAFGKWAVYTIAYYVGMRLLCRHYPHYRHHRNDSVLQEAAYGMRNSWRKISHGRAERVLEARLASDLHRKYFFVPLQTIGDTQISNHSTFVDMQDFIGVVMRSFALHAPAEVTLIIKHHPLDRGRVNHNIHIRRLAKRLGIADRVLPVHDLHLPTCLQNAIGTVTVNSTVGTASLFHGTPTLALGKALWDIDGLTCKGMPLDRFWTHYRPPDKDLFKRFRNCLIDRTQLAGSFYSGFPEALNRRT